MYPCEGQCEGEDHLKWLGERASRDSEITMEEGDEGLVF